MSAAAGLQCHLTWLPLAEELDECLLPKAPASDLTGLGLNPEGAYLLARLCEEVAPSAVV